MKPLNDNDILEGIARVFDGFSIVSGASFFTYISGHLTLPKTDAVGLVFTFILCFGTGIQLRRLKK